MPFVEQNSSLQPEVVVSDVERAETMARDTLPSVFSKENLEERLAEILRGSPQSSLIKDQSWIEQVKKEWLRSQDRWVVLLMESKNSPQDYARVTELVNFLFQASATKSSTTSAIERRINILHQVSELPVLERLARYADEWSDEFSSVLESSQTGEDDRFRLPNLLRRRFLDYLRLEGGLIEGEKYSYLDAKQSRLLFDEYKRLMAKLVQIDDLFDLPETFHTAEYVMDWYRQRPNDTYLRRFFEQYERLSAEEEDESLLHRYLEIFAYYGSHHDIDESEARALWENVLPRLRAKDEAITPFLRDTESIWAVAPGEFGIADFYCHSLVTDPKPSRLAELQLIVQEMPTSNYYALRQNRQDAIDLEDYFPIRDIIHDQRPIVHSLVSAMVRFGSTEDGSLEETEALADLRTVLDRLDQGYGSSESMPEIFEKDRYNQEFFDSNADDIETVLDVLRRLEKNTRPVQDFPPEVSDISLQKLLRLYPRFEGVNEKAKQRSLEEILHSVNTMLQQWMGEKKAGIHPQYIPLLSWLERRCTEQMRSMTYEEQASFLHSPFWLEVLEFHQLTWSGSEFDAEEFEYWIQSLRGLSVAEIAKVISQRVTKDQGKLAQELRQRGFGRLTGALWSGNLAREFMHLFELHQASTSYGQTHRTETLAGGGRGD